MLDKVIGQKYKVLKKIGEGSFGVIYEGKNIETNESVALKTEKKKSPYQQLEYESKLYMLFSSCVNVPKLKYYGEDKKHNILVMDLLGKSLEDLLSTCNDCISLKSVLMLVDQMISSVEYLHQKNFIHRDIKPDNFLMGLQKNKNHVYLLDFGLCKQFRDSKTHEHIPYKTGKDLTGTARYASINSLKGNEVSRRDDMESLGYVWIYLLKGNLPWQGIEAKSKKAKYAKIAEIKETIPLSELCADLPPEFGEYLTRVRALDFEETPDYAGYRALFRNLFQQLGFIYDYKFDWTPKKKGRKSRKHPIAQPEEKPTRPRKSKKRKYETNITESTGDKSQQEDTYLSKSESVSYDINESSELKQKPNCGKRMMRTQSTGKLNSHSFPKKRVGKRRNSVSSLPTDSILCFNKEGKESILLE